jgi:hypothetical protein
MGALLRHLRLPRLGHQARLFVHLNHFWLEIVEIGLPIASSGKSSGDSK